MISSPVISAFASTVPNSSDMIDTSAFMLFITTAGRSVVNSGGFSMRRFSTLTPDNQENDTSVTSHLPRRWELNSVCTFERRYPSDNA